MSQPDRLFRFSKWHVVIYVLFVAMIGYALVEIRRQTLARLDTPLAAQHWQQWRDAARNLSDGEGPVRRRPPSTDDPPALILMRDHFVTCFVGVFLFGTLLFVMSVILIRGVFSRGPSPRVSGEPSRVRLG